jgi:hypothetical protein
MSNQQENTDTGSVSSSESCEHREEWPIRSRFQKKYQPKGIRITAETLKEIHGYDDCAVMPPPHVEMHRTDMEHREVIVQTREGDLTVYLGDWIMEDSDGHHYPIADDEIRQTYEPVSED